MTGEEVRGVRDLLEGAVADGVFPGAVLLVRQSGRVVFRDAVGWASVVPDRCLMSVSTIFDIASLTKVVATTTAAMILAERGGLNLDDRLKDLLPELGGADNQDITVRLLLSHSSGLAPTLPFRELFERPPATPGAASRQRILQAVYGADLAYAPGSETRYSDLGFILLGEIVQRMSGAPFDRFCRREIFGPVEMTDTMFRPAGSASRRQAMSDAVSSGSPGEGGVAPVADERFAATEACPWRGRVMRGEVHDETAYLMGGVAGHAGVFSTADDLDRFAGLILDIHGASSHPSAGLVSHSTVREWTGRTGIIEGSSRALGWDTPSRGCSSSGRFLSSQSFGHTGFTGVSMWLDPVLELSIVLLTNRVHPSRSNTGIVQFRPILHDRVVEAVGHAGA